MKNILLVLLFLILSVIPVYGVEADDSIDDIIKKNFNTYDSSLPKLPKTSPKSIESDTFLDNKDNSVHTKDVKSINNEPKNSIEYNNLPRVPQKVSTRTAKVGFGRKINAKTNTVLSDNLRKGTRVSFVTQAPIRTRKVTVPAGAVINGVVVNSHTPQMFGNGGLLSVKTENISYQGKSAYLEGDILSVNHKLVLFNNIKGDSGYLKAIPKSTKKAKDFYGKSAQVSKKIWNSPLFFIAPVTYLPGAVFLAGSTILSPVSAVFYKGEKVSIPKGSSVTIILTAPLYLEY